MSGGAVSYKANEELEVESARAREMLLNGWMDGSVQ